MLLMLPLYLLAQTPQLGSLTQEDGLRSASVTSVLRDRYGFVFLGTEQGVSRFDGTNILNIDFPKGDAQRNLAVNTMVEQDGQSLLLGNKAGLWQLDRRSLSLRRIYRDAVDVEVFDMVRTADGTLFIATAQGLFRLHDDRVEPVGIFARKQVTNHAVRQLALCRQRLFLITGQLLAEAPIGNPEAITFHHLPDTLANVHLTSLTSARGQVFWVRANGASWSSIPRPESLPLSPVISVACRDFRPTPRDTCWLPLRLTVAWSCRSTVAG